MYQLSIYRISLSARRFYTPSLLKRTFSGSRLHCVMDQSPDLYEYTSGRWLCVGPSSPWVLHLLRRTSWNEELRLAERRRPFNVKELANLAAAAVQRSPKELVKFEKLAEGGLNRTFLLSMRDGFQMVARIPNPMTEPKHLLVASEVATVGYLRSHGIPTPQIYGYSTTLRNSADTECVFMEYNRGINLGDI
jgi:hypothetical protein